MVIKLPSPSSRQQWRSGILSRSVAGNGRAYAAPRRSSPRPDRDLHPLRIRHHHDGTMEVPSASGVGIVCCPMTAGASVSRTDSADRVIAELARQLAGARECLGSLSENQAKPDKDLR